MKNVWIRLTRKLAIYSQIGNVTNDGCRTNVVEWQFEEWQLEEWQPEKGGSSKNNSSKNGIPKMDTSNRLTYSPFVFDHFVHSVLTFLGHRVIVAFTDQRVPYELARRVLEDRKIEYQPPGVESLG